MQTNNELIGVPAELFEIVRVARPSVFTVGVAVARATYNPYGQRKSVSVIELQALTGLSRQTVWDALTDLIERGIIEKKRESKANRYWYRFDSLGNTAAEVEVEEVQQDLVSTFYTPNPVLAPEGEDEQQFGVYFLDTKFAGKPPTIQKLDTKSGKTRRKGRDRPEKTAEKGETIQKLDTKSGNASLARTRARLTVSSMQIPNASGICDQSPVSDTVSDTDTVSDNKDTVNLALTDYFTTFSNQLMHSENKFSEISHDEVRENLTSPLPAEHDYHASHASVNPKSPPDNSPLSAEHLVNAKNINVTIRKRLTTPDVGELEAVFARVRGINPPSWDDRRSAALRQKRWRTPMATILALVGGDIGDAALLIEDTVAYMLEQKLTFSSPDQIVRVAESRYADQQLAYHRNRGSPSPAYDGKGGWDL